MRITERYHRADHDTILYDITITDPESYTRPIVGPHRIMKLRPHDELVEEICVPSEKDPSPTELPSPPPTGQNCERNYSATKTVPYDEYARRGRRTEIESAPVK